MKSFVLYVLKVMVPSCILEKIECSMSITEYTSNTHLPLYILKRNSL